MQPTRLPAELLELRLLLERTRASAVGEHSKALRLLGDLRQQTADAEARLAASARTCQELEARSVKQQQQVDAEAAKAQV
jgi:hypothetical protein